MATLLNLESFFSKRIFSYFFNFLFILGFLYFFIFSDPVNFFPYSHIAIVMIIFISFFTINFLKISNKTISRNKIITVIFDVFTFFIFWIFFWRQIVRPGEFIIPTMLLLLGQIYEHQ